MRIFRFSVNDERPTAACGRSPLVVTTRKRGNGSYTDLGRHAFTVCLHDLGNPPTACIHNCGFAVAQIDNLIVISGAPRRRNVFVGIQFGKKRGKFFIRLRLYDNLRPILSQTYVPAGKVGL